jgi:hypothetical protein
MQIRRSHIPRILLLLAVVASMGSGQCPASCLAGLVAPSFYEDADLSVVLFNNTRTAVPDANAPTSAHIVRQGEIPFLQSFLGPGESRTLPFGRQAKGAQFTFQAFDANLKLLATRTCTWNAQVSLIETAVILRVQVTGSNPPVFSLSCNNRW